MDTQMGLLLARIAILKAEKAQLELDLKTVVFAAEGQVMVIRKTIDLADKITMKRQVVEETGSVMYSAEIKW